MYPVGSTLPRLPCAQSLGGCQRRSSSREKSFRLAGISSLPLTFVLFGRSIWEASRSCKKNYHLLLFTEVVKVQTKAK